MERAGTSRSSPRRCGVVVRGGKAPVGVALYCRRMDTPAHRAGAASGTGGVITFTDVDEARDYEDEDWPDMPDNAFFDDRCWSGDLQDWEPLNERPRGPPIASAGPVRGRLRTVAR